MAEENTTIPIQHENESQPTQSVENSTEQASNSEAKKSSPKKRRSLNNTPIPLTRIRAAMKDVDDAVEYLAADAGLAMARACELFMTNFTKDVFKGGRQLSYDMMAEAVAENDKYAFLRDFVPKRVKYSDVKDELEKQRLKLAPPELRQQQKDAEPSFSINFPTPTSMDTKPDVDEHVNKKDDPKQNIFTFDSEPKTPPPTMFDFDVTAKRKAEDASENPDNTKKIKKMDVDEKKEDDEKSSNMRPEENGTLTIFNGQNGAVDETEKSMKDAILENGHQVNKDQIAKTTASQAGSIFDILSKPQTKTS